MNDLIELALDAMPDAADAADRATEIQYDRLERKERGDVEFLVAEHKGKIIGQVVLRWPGRPDRWGRADRQGFADVEDLHVLAKYQRHGVGAEMIDHVEWLCMREDVDRIGVSVDVSSGSEAAAWFERRGYVRAGDSYVPPSAASQGVEGGERTERVDLIKSFWET